MISLDMLLIVIPVLLVLHKKIVDLFAKHKKVMFVVTLSLPLAHYLLVGFRWQLTLVYLLHGLLVTVMGLLIYKGGEYKIGHKGVQRFCVVLLLFTFVFAGVFPIGNFPEPMGPYKVGTANMTYESETRRELYGKTYNTPRKFVVQYYYPADRIGTRQAPLIENGDVVEAGMSETYGIPKPFLAYLSQLKSSAWYDTGVSENKRQYPIVVLSHGWKGFKNIHTNLAEELASNGYIVASIDHTYGSVATVFQDGSSAKLNPAALPNRSESDDYLMYAGVLLETCKGDILETLDIIEEMNQIGSGSILSGRINLDKISALGHSTGGGAAVKASIEDERIKAVIGMDAWVEPIEPNLILSGMKVPYLHMGSEEWIGGLNASNLHMLLASSSEDRWLITINRSLHTDFTLLSYLSPLSGYLGFTGMGGDQSIEIQRELICSFMAYYVDGKNTKKAMEEVINMYDDATAEVVYKK